MIEAIRTAIIFAIGIAIFPVPIIAMVLLLQAPRGRAGGLGFLGGWVGGLTLVGTIALLMANPYEQYLDTQPPSEGSVIRILFGIGLLVWGLSKLGKQLRPGIKPPAPVWMAKLQGYSPRQSAGLGFALSGLNPKNIALIVGGIAAIADAGVSPAGEAWALLGFVVVASLGVGLPLAAYLALGPRAKAPLEHIQVFMERNSAGIMGVIFALIGLLMITGK